MHLSDRRRIQIFSSQSGFFTIATFYTSLFLRAPDGAPNSEPRGGVLRVSTCFCTRVHANANRREKKLQLPIVFFLVISIELINPAEVFLYGFPSVLYSVQFPLYHVQFVLFCAIKLYILRISFPYDCELLPTLLYNVLFNQLLYKHSNCYCTVPRAYSYSVRQHSCTKEIFWTKKNA